MKSTSTNRKIWVKVAKRMGDTELINAFFTSPIWKLLRKKPGEAFVMLISQFFQAIGAILAYLFTAVKGVKPGILVSGVGLTLMGCLLILFYNSSHVWDFFEALFSFSRPDLSVWKNWDWDKVYDLTVISVNSEFLVGYNILFTGLSLFHTLTNWLGFGSKETSKRGTSYLYLLTKRLFSKYIPVGEFFINVCETVGAIALGIYLIRSGFDVWFGWFLVGIAGNELVILIKDKAAQLHHKPIIEA